MPFHIYDTLQRAKVELSTRDPGKLSMYVCGPTVYDEPHVGHGRTATVFDTIRRYFEWRGLDVTFVSNVTDVDDKIIARAAKTGTTEVELAHQFERVWWEQMDRLSVRRPDHAPHATEYIGPMLDLIAQLLDRDHAYVVEGSGVYFDVVSYPDYGALPHRTLAQLLDSAGARVEVDAAKRNPVDFALWKVAKAGEPAWDSPWGRGRPGWHVECSAMSLQLLGEDFDLHGAGEDLVFPHHENERAQAEASGHPFARHWLHSGMVEVGGEKMSKSLGNFTTLREALDAHGPRAFRLAVLQTHYRKAMELGDRELAAAAGGLERLDSLQRRAARLGLAASHDLDDATAARFRDAMDDDFGTPEALAAIFDAVTAANRALDDEDVDRATALIETVTTLTGVLGIETGEVEQGSDAEIDALVAQRDAARLAKDFGAADRIRAALAERGIVLEDTPTGTAWRRA